MRHTYRMIGFTLAVIPFLIGGAVAAEIEWTTDVEKAFEQAQEEDKLVFVDVTAEWCGYCRMMDRDTFPDADVQEAIAKGFVPLKVDADKDPRAAQEFGTGSLPTFTILTASRSPLVQAPGFHAPDDLLALLEQAEASVRELAALEEEVQNNPQDGAKALELGRRYIMMSRGDDALRVLGGVPASTIQAMVEDDQRELSYLLALSNVAADKFAEAAGLLDAFVEANPDDVRADRAIRLGVESRYLAAKQAMDAGNVDAAIKSFQQVVERSGDFPQLAMRAEAEIALARVLNVAAPELAVDEWLGDTSPTLASLRGKVVLVDFFQIVCPGCKRAKPLIEGLQAKYKDEGLEVIGVATAFENLDMQQKEDVRSYVAQNEFTWPVAVDENMKETFSRYAAMGSPWTVLIDRDGTVRHADFFDESEIEAAIKKLI